MPKNILQDVVPPGRRTIRNVSLGAEGERRPRPSTSLREQDTLSRQEESELRYSRDDTPVIATENPWRRFLPKGIVWILGLGSVAVLVFVLGNFFESAEVSVTEKSERVLPNLSLTAKAESLPGELSYRLFSLNRESEVRVPAEGVEQVETKASGKIVIYNNYSSAPQRLVANTRFETPDGLIYRMSKSVTVPGRTSVLGKAAPGSVEVSVLADAPGDEYNIGLTDFTIPGFKSNPERFKGFYARSKTPMSGGRIGLAPVASEKKLSEARASLRKELEAALVREAKKNAGREQVFFDGAYKINFETLPPIESGADISDAVAIRERAVLSAVFLPRSEIAAAIAENTIQKFDGAPVTVLDESTLVFSLKNKNVFSPTSVGPIAFTLKGLATLVWQFDGEKLKSELAGKSKGELEQIIRTGHPGVLQAEAVLRPFWKKSFPASPEKIKLKLSEI